jgi:hypothetical protein
VASGAGANYKNVSHAGLFTEALYTLHEEIRGNLDKLLRVMAQADMFAVISLATGPGRSELTLRDCGCWIKGSKLLEKQLWQNQSLPR